ncbi:MAG: alpha/beta fold hydrolase [Alcanivoracaceae bacterium]|nr:alpha/beta fold hydrolase [Alcanivoracaceae bacterium]
MKIHTRAFLLSCLLSLLLSQPALGEEQMTPANAAPLKSWLPSTPPTGVIIALHSFGDYSAAFDLIGPWFAEKGYAVYAWDQHGFGSNDDARTWPGADTLENDLLNRFSSISAKHKNIPIYLLGESLGGAVAINVTARHPELNIEGLILLAPAVREGIPWRYAWNVAIGAVSLVRPGYLLEVPRSSDDPRFNPVAAQRLAEDPLVHREVRMKSYQGLIRYADRASNIAPTLSTPTLLMYGGKDASVPAVSIARLREHWQNHVSYIYYPDGPHLLLQSKQWQQVADNMMGWLQHESINQAHAASAENFDGMELQSNTAH